MATDRERIVDNEVLAREIARRWNAGLRPREWYSETEDMGS